MSSLVFSIFFSMVLISAWFVISPEGRRRKGQSDVNGVRDCVEFHLCECESSRKFFKPCYELLKEKSQRWLVNKANEPGICNGLNQKVEFVPYEENAAIFCNYSKELRSPCFGNLNDEVRAYVAKLSFTMDAESLDERDAILESFHCMEPAMIKCGQYPEECM